MQDDNEKNRSHDKEEKERKFLLWSGMVFFMTLIISLWGFNFSNVFNKINSGRSGLADNMESELHVSDTMKEIKEQFQELEKIKDINIDETASGGDQETGKEGRLLHNMKEDLEKSQ
jgi:hypothetical protein